MAAFNIMNIMNHTRPCWVEGRRAIFHRWTDSARPVKPRGMEDDETTERYQLHSVHALVEYEDGTMQRVWPRTVRFADSEMYFAEYDWEAMAEKRDTLPFVATVDMDKIAPETPDKKSCTTCAHCGEYEEFCKAADNLCRKCSFMNCVCRTCMENYEGWEPKGGAAL